MNKMILEPTPEWMRMAAALIYCLHAGYYGAINQIYRCASWHFDANACSRSKT